MRAVRHHRRQDRPRPARRALRRRRTRHHSQGLARVRAAADWIENAVTRGEVDLDEQLMRLLKGSGE
nr:DUF6192 family protein [Streptomyces sp. JV178]